MKTPFTSQRRKALASLALLAGLSAFSGSALAAFPERPVRLVVGFAAGTGPDILARLLAQQLSNQWGGMAVTVDNKPGAAGLISAQDVARPGRWSDPALCTIRCLEHCTQHLQQAALRC